MYHDSWEDDFDPLSKNDFGWQEWAAGISGVIIAVVIAVCFFF